MTRPRFSHLILSAVCLAPLPAFADHYGPSWMPEFGLEEGLSFGGGDLMSSDITRQPRLTPGNVSLFAGDTLFVHGYYRQAIGRTGLSFKATAGLGFGCQVPTCLDQLGDNPPYQFTTVVGEAAVEYAWAGGRIGVGPSAHYVNAITSTSTVYAFQEVDLKPAYGWFIEYQYDKVGLRYTHVIFHSREGVAIDGSNLGMYVHLNYRDEDWYPGGQYFDRGEAVARETVALVLHPKEWSF